MADWSYFGDTKDLYANSGRSMYDSDEPEKEKPSAFRQFFNGIVQGTKKTIGEFTEVLPSLAYELFGNTDKANQKLDEWKQRLAKLDKEYPVTSLENVGSEPIGAIASLLGESVPTLASILIPGSLAAKGVAKAAPTLAARSLTVPGTEFSIKAGQAIGLGAAGAAEGIPSSYATIEAETGQKRPDVAAVAGILQGALNAIPGYTTLERWGGEAFTASVLKRVLSEAGLQAGIGAGAGAASAAVQEMANHFVDANKGSLEKILYGALGGGITGGALGAITGGFGSKSKIEPKADEEVGPPPIDQNVEADSFNQARQRGEELRQQEKLQEDEALNRARREASDLSYDDSTFNLRESQDEISRLERFKNNVDEQLPLGEPPPRFRQQEEYDAELARSPIETKVPKAFGGIGTATEPKKVVGHRVSDETPTAWGGHEVEQAPPLPRETNWVEWLNRRRSNKLLKKGPYESNELVDALKSTDVGGLGLILNDKVTPADISKVTETKGANARALYEQLKTEGYLTKDGRLTTPGRTQAQERTADLMRAAKQATSVPDRSEAAQQAYERLMSKEHGGLEMKPGEQVKPDDLAVIEKSAAERRAVFEEMKKQNLVYKVGNKWVLREPEAVQETRRLLEEANKITRPLELRQEENFYSALTESIQQTPMKAGTPQQWINAALKQGVKMGEIDWSNLKELNPNQRYSREEILAHIKPQEVRFEESTSRGELTDEEIRKLNEVFDNDKKLDELYSAKYDVVDNRRLSETPGETEGIDYLGIEDLFKKYKHLLSDDTAFEDYGGEYTYNSLYDQIRHEIEERQIELRAKVGISDTRHKFEQWTMPGEKKKYREITFKLPNLGYDEPHFGRDVMMHARLSEREVNDKPTLHVDEIQSNLHQQGAQEGYSKKVHLTEDNLKDHNLQLKKFNDFWFVERINEERGFIRTLSQGKTKHEAIAEAEYRLNSERLPDAPLKKEWQDYVIKRILQIAAKEGYDQISWTPGNWQEKIYGRGGNPEFYDRILPDKLNNIGKKYGTKVEKGVMPQIVHHTNNDPHGWPITERPVVPVMEIPKAMKEAYLKPQALWSPMSKATMAAMIAAGLHHPVEAAPKKPVEIVKKQPTLKEEFMMRSQEPSQIHGSARDFVLTKDKDTGIEHLVAIDNNSGKAISVESTGHGNKVTLSSALTKAMNDPSNRIIIHHNHPDAIHAKPLSPADVATLGSRGVLAIVAHGGHGQYSIARLSAAAKAYLDRLASVEPRSVDGANIAFNNTVVDLINTARKYSSNEFFVQARKSFPDYQKNKEHKLLAENFDKLTQEAWLRALDDLGFIEYYSNADLKFAGKDYDRVINNIKAGLKADGFSILKSLKGDTDEVRNGRRAVFRSPEDAMGEAFRGAQEVAKDARSETVNRPSGELPSTARELRQEGLSDLRPNEEWVNKDTIKNLGRLDQMWHTVRGLADKHPILRTWADALDTRRAIRTLKRAYYSQKIGETLAKAKDKTAIMRVLEAAEYQKEALDYSKGTVRVAVPSDARTFLSRPDSVVTLSGPDVKVLQELQQHMNELRNDLVKSLLVRAGKPENIPFAELRKGDDADKRLADLIQTLYAHPNYFPHIRHGDVAIAVKDAKGNVIHLQTFELAGKPGSFIRKQARKMADAKMKASLENLKRKYAGYEVTQPFDMTYDTYKKAIGNPVADLRVALDMFASEGKLSDEVWKDIENHLMAKGIRQNYLERKNIPGWINENNSKDYLERALDTYLMRASAAIGNNRSYRKLQEGIERINALKNESFRKYVNDVMEHINSGAEDAQVLKNISFMYYLGFNLSSAVLNATQTFHTTWPMITTIAGAKGNGDILAGYKLATALIAKDPRLLIGGNPSEIVSKIDLKKYIKDDAKREAFIKALLDGDLAPMQSFDFAGDENFRIIGNSPEAAFKRLNRAAASFFSTAEVFNRIATWGAFYDAFQRPGTLEKADKIFGKQGMWQAMKERDGLNASSAAAEMVKRTQFVMDTTNKPMMSRGPVQGLLTQFMSYNIQMLETWNQMWGKRSGAEGKKVAALMALGMIMTSGVWSMPAAGNLKDGIEALYKQLFDEGIDLDLTVKKIFDEIALYPEFATHMTRGFVPAATGISLATRAGAGRIVNTQALSGSFDNLLGPSWGMTAGSVKDFMDQWRNGNHMLAIGEVMPLFIQNHIKAIEASKSGFKSPTGKVYQKPEDTSLNDIFLQSYGFRPEQVARRSDYYLAEKNFGNRLDALTKHYHQNIAAAQEQLMRAKNQGDAQEARKKIALLMNEVLDYNRGKKPADTIKLNLSSIKQMVNQRLNYEGNMRGVPQRMRDEVQRMMPLYGV